MLTDTSWRYSTLSKSLFSGSLLFHYYPPSVFHLTLSYALYTSSFPSPFFYPNRSCQLSSYVLFISLAPKQVSFTVFPINYCFYEERLLHSFNLHLQILLWTLLLISLTNKCALLRSIFWRPICLFSWMTVFAGCLLLNSVCRIL